jgi:GNAT superfamily N-acetyltransferase
VYPQPRRTASHATSGSRGGLTLRPAAPDDAETLGAIVAEGFEGYRAFAPEGWEPPAAAGETATLRERLGDHDVWCAVAEVRGSVAGHVAFLPASRARRPERDPGLAHLWQLFVRPPFWGTGVAGELHAAATAAAAQRGFRVMRLFTPTAHVRARRFYEREGWQPHGEPAFEAGLGLEIVEYRRALVRRPPG